MEGVFIMAQSSTHVISAITASAHPRWCTAEHVNTGPNLHQSPDLLLGHVADIPVNAQRIHIDPEPGHPEARDDVWLSFGPHFTEVPLGEARTIAQQLRNIAAALELFAGGA